MRIYPNPTTGIVQIEPLNNHEIESIIITNEIGKTWEMKPAQNQLDLTGMPAGMYFLDISLLSGDLVKTKLIISQIKMDTPFGLPKTTKTPVNTGVFVELTRYTGFEPVTSALSRQRSKPTELIALLTIHEDTVKF